MSEMRGGVLKVLHAAKHKDKLSKSKRYNARFSVERDNHGMTMSIEYLPDK
jgi:hypothetical protein